MLACAGNAAADPRPGTRPLLPSTGRFELTLSYAEFTLLHDLARSAPGADTGRDELRVRLSNGPGGMAWIVSPEGSGLAERLEIAAAERIVALVDALDFTRGWSDSTRAGLAVAQALHSKIKHARTHLLGERVNLSGALRGDASGWKLEAGSGLYPLEVGALRSAPEDLAGHQVVVDAETQDGNQLKVLSMVERRLNTLDLFVMSLCGIAQRAELDVIGRMMSPREEVAPVLQIHYIFYRGKPGSGGGFTALHGEAEMRENVIQMILRDDYPASYWPYLRLRAARAGPWEELAREAGLAAADVMEIARIAPEQREARVRKEFEAVALDWGVLDGSPALRWEGAPVRQLSEIPFFGGAGAAAGSCSSAE